MIVDNRVSHIFNEMEDEYDEIVDLWYSWLFSRLHYYIAKNVIVNIPTNHNLKVLDVGCGTGFQSVLFAQTGAKVAGIDISEKLIDVAIRKGLPSGPNINFFPEEYSFVSKYNRKVSWHLKRFEKKSKIMPEYHVMDATSISYPENDFDLINCCGSTLSFVEDYKLALLEFKKCLQPNGTLILEVEAKRNFDLLWTLLDATILFGKLGYETSFKEAIDLVFKHIGRHASVEYPFGEVKNPVYMNIRLFHKRRILKELRNMGFEVKKTYSIHSITNILPSTFLDSEKPSKTLKSIFKFLARLEELFGYKLPGCSLFIICKKCE